jgi:hypothetical protein
MLILFNWGAALQIEARGVTGKIMGSRCSAGPDPVENSLKVAFHKAVRDACLFERIADRPESFL